MRLSRIVRSASLVQAEELDPHKKVKELLDHTTKLWEHLSQLNKGLDLNVGDFYLKYPKTAEARKVMDSLGKKIKEIQLSAFRTMGILKKLDKLKD